MDERMDEEKMTWKDVFFWSFVLFSLGRFAWCYAHVEPWDVYWTKRCAAGFRPMSWADRVPGEEEHVYNHCMGHRRGRCTLEGHRLHYVLTGEWPNDGAQAEAQKRR